MWSPPTREGKRDSPKDNDLSQVREKGKQKPTGKEERAMVPEDGFNWHMEVEGLVEDTVMQGR